MAIHIWRREFIVTLGSVVAWPLAAGAQVSSKRRPLIAWLAGGASKGPGGTYPTHFLDGMRDLGYVEGLDFDMVYRFAEGFQDRLLALAEEVIRLKPDIIMTGAINAAVSAHNVTSTIPIVCPALADAVYLGLIASEARPGGNVTGIAPYVSGLPAKQLEFAREIVPGTSRIGLLTNIQYPKAAPQQQELAATAKVLGITLVEADINIPDEIDGAVQALASKGVYVVIILQSTVLLNFGGRIAEAALAKRLPTVYGYRENVVAGGLISYGVDLRWCYRPGAYFVDKILHPGAALDGKRGGVLLGPKRRSQNVCSRTGCCVGFRMPLDGRRNDFRDAFHVCAVFPTGRGRSRMRTSLSGKLLSHISAIAGRAQFNHMRGSRSASMAFSSVRKRASSLLTPRISA